MPETEPPKTFRYKGFLSYRSADRRAAERLHKAIETFRIPKSLAKIAGKRPGRIFRDRDEARTSDDIESIIAQEISKSEHLIVLCTPAAARPEAWVGREIELFRERRPDGKIHAVIGAGEPPDCFPPQLISADPSGRPKLPLAADIRTRRNGGQDGYRRAVAKVAAGLTGLDFDDLWKRAERRRRAMMAAWTGAAAGVLLMVAGVYAYAGLSHFVREDGERLAVYRGLPGLNPPGLPRRVWILSDTAADLVLPDGVDPARAVVTAGPGEDVMAGLEALFRPEMIGMRHYMVGDDGAARLAALDLMDRVDAEFETRLRAGLLLAETATLDDWDRLSAMTRSERAEIRKVAVMAMFRLDAARAFAGLDHLKADDWTDMQTDLIRLTQAPCTPDHAAMLAIGFASPSNQPENETIIDAALRAGCDLPVAALAQGTVRSSMTGPQAIAHFARIRGMEISLAQELAPLLEGMGENDLSQWRIRDVLSVYTAISGTCLPGLPGALDYAYAEVRLTAMEAIAELCDGFTLAITPAGDGAQLRVTLSAEAGALDETVDLSSGATFSEQLFLFGLIERRRPVGVEPVLRAVAETAEDDQMRARAFTLLTRLGERTPAPADWLEANDYSLRTAAIERDLLANPESAAERLLPLLGTRDEYYEGQIGRMPLSAEQLDRVRAQLAGNAAQRRQAACVLAMQAGADEVVALATDPDADIRERALDCAPYNAAAEAILAELPQAVNGFPVSGYRGFRQQVAQKAAFEVQLAALPPEMRAWRLEIADRTPGGFGLWGRGMRLWLEEALYRQQHEPR